MKSPWIAGLVGIAALVAIARPDAVFALYDQVYPGDQPRRQALDACFIEDAAFNRLDSAARGACYDRKLPSRQRPALAAGPHLAAPYNFVDRWREAGEGHLAQNDIRAEQRNRR